MIKERYTTKGVHYVRVTRKSAKRLFDKSKTIYLIANNVRWNNHWLNPCPICNEDKLYTDCEFEHIVDDFMYYNCNYQFGYKVKYFVKEEDLK